MIPFLRVSITFARKLARRLRIAGPSSSTIFGRSSEGRGDRGGWILCGGILAEGFIGRGEGNFEYGFEEAGEIG